MRERNTSSRLCAGERRREVLENGERMMRLAYGERQRQHHHHACVK